LADRKPAAFRENIHRLFDEAKDTDLAPGIVSLIESRATHAQIREVPVGKILPATVTSLLSFGAFARLEAGVEGLIHASEIPEADRKPIKEILAEGERVQVRVLHVDASHQRLGLSMKLEELQ